MSFRMSGSDFELLVKYMEKRAKGSDITMTINPSGAYINLKVSDLNGDEANITVYDKESSITPQIAVKRGLGNEIK